MRGDLSSNLNRSNRPNSFPGIISRFAVHILGRKSTKASGKRFRRRGRGERGFRSRGWSPARFAGPQFASGARDSSKSRGGSPSVVNSEIGSCHVVIKKLKLNSL